MTDRRYVPLVESLPDGPLMPVDVSVQPANGDVLTFGPNGYAPTPGGGGSGAIRQAIIPIAFNTPNIVATGGNLGIVVATIQDGEVVLFTDLDGDLKPPAGPVWIDTAWDGTTVRGIITVEDSGNNTTVLNNSFNMKQADSNTIGGGLGDLWTQNNLTADPLGGNGAMLCRGGPVTVFFGVDDGAGGNPGSSQGAGEIRLYIAAAT